MVLIFCTVFRFISAPKNFNFIANQHQNITNTKMSSHSLLVHYTLSSMLRLEASFSRVAFGGVFANFQEQRIRLSDTLFPVAALMGIISDISCKSSFVSFTLKEPTLASIFLVLVVPTKHKESSACLQYSPRYFALSSEHQFV